MTTNVLACDLTALQKAAGYITLDGALQIGGILLFVAGLIFVFRGLVTSLLKEKTLIEVIAWLLTLGGMGSNFFLSPAVSSWTVPIGALILPGAIALSAHLRNLPKNENRFLLILMIVWGGLAIFHNSSLIGFFAVAALISLLGLSIIVTPFCYSFGFKDDKSLGQGTFAGFFVTAAYMVMTLVGSHLSYIEVFRSGALWLGTFAWFLGILILSTKWVAKNDYFGRQVMAIASFVVAIFIGNMLGMKEVTTIAMAFLLFYAADKIIEVPTDGFTALGIKLIAAGGLLYGVWTWVQANPSIVQRYTNMGIRLDTFQIGHS